MPFKCPHCGKSIPNSLVTAYSGKIGGRKIAKRGPEYFRELQAKRLHKRGGRPRLEESPSKPI